MDDLIDLERYPLDARGSDAHAALVADCRAALARDNMFTLQGFLRPAATTALAGELAPRFAAEAFRHARRHNIFFRKSVPGLAADHPVLAEMETVNHTLCADQLAGTALRRLYDWPAFAAFLADALGTGPLYPMADPLAAVNAMAYHDGEALNWHFDRSEFTTTLLLQAPDAGGEFEYRPGLRDGDTTDFDGVAALVAGRDDGVRRRPLAAGALNVFRGRDTAHRVSPVVGDRARIIAVFSYFDRPGVTFTPAERAGFYGREG